MVKEIFAILMLVLLLAGVLINLNFVINLTDNLLELVEESKEYALEGKWELSQEKAEKAEQMWQKVDSYTHVTVRHSEIEAASAAFFNLLSEIYKKDSGGVLGASRLLYDQINSISHMERVSLGTIF